MDGCGRRASGHGRQRDADMKKTFLPFLLGLAGVVGVVRAFATGESNDTDDVVVLGEVDLAERAEILRNRFRRMTPGGFPLVQDVGAWPAAWEEFGAHWISAPAMRDLATWLVPVSMAQENGCTVLRDADGTELWRGATDFSKDDSATVTLTGSLVDEADWPLYEAAKAEIATLLDAASPKGGRGGVFTNGLRFTNMWTETNGDYRLEFAWEEDGDVEVFCRAMHTTSWVETVVWTNDENEVVTNDFTRWRQLDTFHGIPDAWELVGVVAVTNGGGSFTDTNHVPDYDRVRFYAAAKLEDTDGDGMTDGEGWLWNLDSPNTDTDNDGLSDYDERKLHKTDPDNPDTDGDGLGDGYEVTHGTDPLKKDSDQDGLPDGWEVFNGLNPLVATGVNGPDGDLDNDDFSNALEFELGAPANNPAWNGEELAWKLVHYTSSVTTSGGIITTNWHGLRVEVEDSLDCGGTNNGIQNETAVLSVPALLDCGYYIELVVTGCVEDVDANYDVVSFEAAETNVLFSSHDGIPDEPGYEEECIMVGESSTANHLILANSDVTLRYDTVGYKWHCGGYAEVISAVVTAPVVADFQEVRERNAPCNRVPNPKQKHPIDFSWRRKPPDKSNSMPFLSFLQKSARSPCCAPSMREAPILPVRLPVQAESQLCLSRRWRTYKPIPFGLASTKTTTAFWSRQSSARRRPRLTWCRSPMRIMQTGETIWKTRHGKRQWGPTMSGPPFFTVF